MHTISMNFTHLTSSMLVNEESERKKQRANTESREQRAETTASSIILLVKFAAARVQSSGVTMTMTMNVGSHPRSRDAMGGPEIDLLVIIRQVTKKRHTKSQADCAPTGPFWKSNLGGQKFLIDFVNRFTLKHYPRGAHEPLSTPGKNQIKKINFRWVKKIIVPAAPNLFMCGLKQQSL